MSSLYVLYRRGSTLMATIQLSGICEILRIKFSWRFHFRFNGVSRVKYSCYMRRNHLCHYWIRGEDDVTSCAYSKPPKQNNRWLTVLIRKLDTIFFLFGKEFPDASWKSRGNIVFLAQSCKIAYFLSCMIVDFAIALFDH